MNDGQPVPLSRLAFAATLGLGVLAAGTHPFSVASEQQVVDKPHYEVVKQRNGWWGRRMIVSGMWPWL